MEDIPLLKHRLGLKNHLYRFLWSVSWTIFVRPIPRTFCNSWKLFILRFFGAKVASTALVYSSASIYDPRNLIMENGACIGPKVDCYNVDMIHIGVNALISQKTYLCTASHNFHDVAFELITAPITIEDNAWVAADAYIGMGVTVGKNAVVGARSSVFKDVPPNVVVGGNPAKFIKNRY